MNARSAPPHPDPLPEGEGNLATPPPPRSPWQRLYGAAHRARAEYRRGRALALPLPVVSVGNLHWGGGGKTPLVAAIAAWLVANSRRPAILSRGWGRRAPGSLVVVSDGSPGGRRLGWEEAGDEPALLAQSLPGVPIIVGADRHAAGLHALDHLPSRPDIFLLDDGFSHLHLRRDIDLLALPAADPFGGGRLWPSGRLREPLAAAARADGAVLTGVTAGPGGPSGGDLERALQPFGFAGRGFTSATHAGPARTFDGAPLRPGARVVLVAGVARPASFAAAARAQGFQVAAELYFRDHHAYPAASLATIARLATTSGADAVLVTSKDAVKLKERAARLGAVRFAELPIRAEPDGAFWPWLDQALARAPGGEL